mgnify:CR=1 FL=1
MPGIPASSRHKGGCHMVQTTVTLDNATAAFYRHVAGLAGLPLEPFFPTRCSSSQASFRWRRSEKKKNPPVELIFCKHLL